MVLSFFKKKKKDTRPAQGAAYYQLLVTEVIHETPDAISIHFENPGQQIQYKPGQFLSLVFQVDGEEIRRSYSLSTSPYSENYLGVTVKRLDHGKVSNYINESIQPGDRIQAMEPKGNFIIDVDPAARRNIVLLAGGSGITPLFSIGKAVLAREPESRVTLVYQNRNESSIIYKNILDSYQARYPDFRILHYLSQPGEGWTGRKGRISKSDVENIVKDCLGEKDRTPSFYVCGPHGMMETIIDTLLGMGIPKPDIHKESYVAASTKAAAHEAPPALAEEIIRREVTIQLNGEEYKIMVEPHRFILETALDADINMPFSCQSGLCTACRGKLISGKVKMDNPDGLSDEEIAQGYVLTCVSHPLTDDVVIEIG